MTLVGPSLVPYMGQADGDDPMCEKNLGHKFEA